jgi:small subunit ribosomal protein S17
MPETGRTKRKNKIGIVVSNRMSKTIIVRVERLVRHPVYSRVVRQISTFKAHDEKNDAHIGDRVLISETRPLSRDKRWRLEKILERAKETAEV